MTPTNDGNVIRLQVPELTEERRKEMVRIVHNVAEEGRVAVRNIRRDVMGDLRELKGEGEVGEDDERRAEEQLQKVTDERGRRDRRPDEGQGRRDPHGLSGEAPAASSVAIIMDGNARWATERGLPILEGHREGARTLKQTVKDAVRLGLAELTVYAFSTENWSRPTAEVDGLMAMFAELIASETPELDEQGVRMRFIGRREEVSAELRDQMAWAEKRTAGNDRLTLFVAFNYGGRAEILDAAERYRGAGRRPSPSSSTRRR